MSLARIPDYLPVFEAKKTPQVAHVIK